MTPPPDILQIFEHLRAFGWQPGRDGCLVVSRRQMPPLPAEIGPSDLKWLGAVGGVRDLEGVPRCPYALVFDQLPHMDSESAAQLLARLRDCLAERVMVADEQAILPAADMLSLGYIRREPGLPGVSLYVYDPDACNPGREWNNADRWANPENFTRYRW